MTDWSLSDGGAFASSGLPLGSLEMRECDEPDGALRVIVAGEIDMGAAEGLTEGLGRLDPHGRRVRLDLSRLSFLDCYGLRALLAAVGEARAANWAIEVDRQVSGAVGRMVELAGVGPVLWPPDAAPAPV